MKSNENKTWVDYQRGLEEARERDAHLRVLVSWLFIAGLLAWVGYSLIAWTK